MFDFDSAGPGPGDKFNLGAKAKTQVEEKPTVHYRQLPASLSELNMEQELLTQYQSALNMMEDVKHDEETPANQKAQVLNSITAILTNIVKMQTDLYNAERLKALESTLILTLKQFPDVQTAFVEAYKKAVNA